MPHSMSISPAVHALITIHVERAAIHVVVDREGHTGRGLSTLLNVPEYLPEQRPHRFADFVRA